MPKNELININKLVSNVNSIIERSKATIYKSINSEMVRAYFEIGREIVEEEQKGKDRADYGKNIIINLSKELTKQHGKGYSITNLWYFRQFYMAYQKIHSLRGELSWTHYRLLMKIDEDPKRSFYEVECINNNWSTRELERQINSLLYERLALSKDKDAVMNMAQKGQEYNVYNDIVKDPYVLEFLGLKQYDKLYENKLETALLEHLQEFLLELGKGFSFVARQKRLSMDGEHFFVDLVFYNYMLKCFVLIDLKTGKLTHQDIGQMQMYVNYYSRELMNEGDNKPIGIVLCAEKSKAVVKYTLPEDNQQIFTSKYKLYLPTEEELQAELLKEKHLIETVKALEEDIKNY